MARAGLGRLPFTHILRPSNRRALPKQWRFWAHAVLTVPILANFLVSFPVELLAAAAGAGGVVVALARKDELHRLPAGRAGPWPSSNYHAGVNVLKWLDMEASPRLLLTTRAARLAHVPVFCQVWPMVKGSSWRWRFLLCVPALLVFTQRAAFVDEWGAWEDEALRFYEALGHRPMVEIGQGPLSEPLQLGDWTTQASDSFEVVGVLRDHTTYSPAYYLLAHWTMRLTGTRSIAALRLWNALFSALTALGIVLLAGRAHGYAASFALIGVFLSPWDFSIAIQFKALAAAICCGVWSTYALRRLLQAPSSPWALLYAVAIGTGLLTHSYIALVAAIQGLWAIGTYVRRRAPPSIWWRWAVASTGAALCALAWFSYAGPAQMRYLSSVREAFNGPYVGAWNGVASLWQTYLVNLTGHDASAWLSGTLGLGLIGLALTTLWRRREVGLLIALSFGAAACLYLAFVMMENNQVLMPRYAVIFMPYFWLAAGHGAELVVGELPQRARVPVAAGLVACVCAIGVYHWIGVVRRAFPQDAYADWRAVTGDLSSRVEDQDGFIHAPPNGAFLAFALHWNRPTMHVGFPPGLDDADPEATMKKLGRARCWWVLSWTALARQEELARRLAAGGHRIAERRTFPGVVAWRVEPAPAETKTLEDLKGTLGHQSHF